MIQLFTKHPQSVGESYLEHLCMASGFAGSLLIAAVICAVHAILPFMFEKTGSRMIADLYHRTGPGRVRNTSAASATEVA